MLPKGETVYEYMTPFIILMCYMHVILLLVRNVYADRLLRMVILRFMAGKWSERDGRTSFLSLTPIVHAIWNFIQLSVSKEQWLSYNCL